MKRKLILLLALLALMLGLPGVAQAGGDDDGGSGGNSGNNSAVAINKKNGSALFKFAFAIRRVMGDVVDNQNAAVAYSSCQSCRTTAIAIQIVFVVGSPSTVTPTNLALAINENCTACQSFAAAFQFVVGVPDASVQFTREGKIELKAILSEFKALKRENYTLEEFHARTQALAQRLRTLLKTQLVSKRDEGEGGGDEGSDDEEDVGDETDEDERPAPPPPPTTTDAETTTDAATTTTESTTTATTTEPTPTETETETETETGPGETTTTP